MADQQVHHHAFVGRIEMLNQDERHAAGGRQCADELPTGVETARRGANSHDRKVVWAIRGAVRLPATSVLTWFSLNKMFILDVGIRFQVR